MREVAGAVLHQMVLGLPALLIIFTVFGLLAVAYVKGW